MNPAVAAADEPWWIDLWSAISSTGVTNIATAVGVLVALWLGLKASRDRRDEQEAEALADARMTRVQTVRSGAKPFADGWLNDEDGSQEPPDDGLLVRCNLENHSDSPILNVRFEVLVGQQTFDDTIDVVPPWGDGHRSGDSRFWITPEGIENTVPVSAWRVTWSDRHGSRWVVDEIKQVTPRKFSGNERLRSNPLMGDG